MDDELWWSSQVKLWEMKWGCRKSDNICLQGFCVFCLIISSKYNNLMIYLPPPSWSLLHKHIKLILHPCLPIQKLSRSIYSFSCIQFIANAMEKSSLIQPTCKFNLWAIKSLAHQFNSNLLESQNTMLSNWRNLTKTFVSFMLIQRKLPEMRIPKRPYKLPFW